MEILSKHSWPGNIRELENLVERCYAYGFEIIDPQNLPLHQFKTELEESPKLKDVIKKHVKLIVSKCDGNLSKAKSILGLGSINTLKKYLHEKD